MHLRTLNAGLPFSLTCDNGLGVSQSTQNVIGSFLPKRAFGQADVQCHINMANGNAYIQDHKLSFTDIGSEIEIAYTYNSQSNEWQLAFGQQIKKIEDKKSITLVEADGREIQYIYDVEKKCYLASEYQDGQPFIRYDAQNATWERIDSNTRTTAIYNTKCQLIASVDDKGNKTTYQYDAYGQLKTIVAPSQKAYEIKRSKNQIEICLEGKTLHTYVLNAQGQLQQSITSDQYKVNYDYHADGKLKSIIQTDSSTLSFAYSNEKIASVQVGENADNTFSLEYADKTTKLTDASGTVSQLSFDKDQRQIIFASNENKKEFQFLASGQIEKIIGEDQSEESFEYTSAKLLKKHTKRDGTVIEYEYANEESPQPLLIRKQTYANVNATQKFVTQFIYDTLSNGHAVLRYKISPQGRVKEYIVNQHTGLVEGVRAFLQVTYTQLALDTLPTTQSMSQWCYAHLAQSSLTTYQHDQQGRVNEINKFAQVTVQGNGISDEQTQQEMFAHDVWGNITEHDIKSGLNKKNSTTYAYNDCGLLTEHCVGQGTSLEKKTTHSYVANEIKTTLPNGREEIKTFDSSGLLVANKANVEQNTREFSYDIHPKERIRVITRPDQKKIIEAYDAKQRLIATVSPSGFVQAIEYNDQHRYQKTTQYAQVCHPSVLLAGIHSLPDTFATSVDDRCTYQFFGLNNKTSFSVDANNYLTEYQYDLHGNLKTTIQYAAPISASELALLCSGNTLNRELDQTQDRVQRNYYDADGLKIAEQDGAGYVTQYIHDAGGRVTHTINYANKNINVSDQFVLPLESDEDAHHYYFYNALNQCDLEVDAEGYISTHTYHVDGKKQKTTRYEIPILQIDPQAKPIPVESNNDRHTEYFYDEIRRLTRTESSMGEIQTYTHDAMDHLVAQSQQDIKQPDSALGDAYRASECQYDAWEQKIASANPFMAQLIKEIKLQKLPADEEAKEIKAIWETSSAKQIYDVTGLKIQSIDSLGNITRYYYDQDRRPVLFIDPTGAVIKHELNAFAEIEQEYGFYNRIAVEELEKLTGGFVDDTIIALLSENKDKDVITTFKRDQRGQVIAKTDAENNISTYEYNAFKACTHEHLPVNAKTADTHLEHHYDVRGLETETIKTNDQDNKQIIIKYEHNHLGKETKITDEVGAVTEKQLDKLGRLKQQTQSVTATEKRVTKEITYDAFDRPRFVFDAAKRQTEFIYDDKERTTTVQHPIQGTKDIIKKNIFGEPIETKNAFQKRTALIEHAPDGQLLKHTDGLDNVQSIDYDLSGKKKAVIDAEKNKISFTYNASGYLKEEIVADGKLNLKTTFEPNAFGENETIVDPRKVKTQQSFDRVGNLVKKLQDADGLKILTKNQYNAQHQLTDTEEGFDGQPSQWHKRTVYDAQNRPTKTIIDPKTKDNQDALEIENQFVRDAAGKVIKEIDAKGHPKYSFYNLLGQKRFEIEPIDDKQFAVVKWDHTVTGKIAGQRVYQDSFAFQSIEQKTLAEVETLTIPNKEINNSDSTTLYFYDENDRERFNVKVLFVADAHRSDAYIEEKQYDLAGRVIKKTQYATKINACSYAGWTTESLAEQIQKNTVDDRTNFYWYDDASQERFIVDRDGRVHEKRYDKNGKVISKITYFQQCHDFEKYSGQSADEFAKQITSTDQDREERYVYDACGRLKYKVDAKNIATRYTYDENGNQIERCIFADAIVETKSYEELVAALDKLVPTPNKDAITTKIYDQANRLQSIVNALGYKDEFERDAIGNAVAHTDRAGQKWKNEYDRANRLIREISPTTTVTTTQKTPDGKLASTETQTSVVKKTTWDKVNNTTSITEGEGLEDARTCHFKYGVRKEILNRIVENVEVDDPVQAASLTTPPTVVTDVITQMYYNAKKQKVSECNENNEWTFYVRDSLGRLIYKVINNIATKYSYNAFNQIETECECARPIPTDLTPYRETGIPELIMFTLTLPSDQDRVKTYHYDGAGKVTDIISSAVYYYVDENNHGIAKPLTQKFYNAFGDCVHESKLISPDVWADKFYWHDKHGKVIAEVDENKYLKTFERDAKDNVIKRTEYANALTINISEKLSVKELIAATTASEKDRVRLYKYNLLGKKTEETIVQVTAQDLEFNGDKPQIIDKPKQDYTIATTYTPLGNVESVCHEDGSAEYKEYDERGLQSAHVHVPRRSQNDKGEEIIITPKTEFKRNAFGQVVSKVQSAETKTFKDAPENLHTEKKEGFVALNRYPKISHEAAVIGDSNDKKDKGKERDTAKSFDVLAKEFSLFDNRGLLSAKQNASGYLQHYTFGPDRKHARKMEVCSTWVKTNPPNCAQQMHLDETRWQWDPNTRIKTLITLRDNQVEEKTYTQLNAFGDVIGKGDDAKTWPVFRKLDASGRCWSHNETSVKTISLYDLRGLETLSLQAANDDLSLIDYTQLESLLSWDTVRLERNEKQHDARGSLIACRAPYWYADRKPQPTKSYAHDHWRNVVQETNSLGETTDYEFNHSNLMTKKITPIVEEMNDNFDVVNKKLETKFAYTSRKFPIGIIDPKGHHTCHVVDEVGQNTAIYLGDGTRRKLTVYDGLGFISRVTDARDQSYRYQHTPTGHVISVRFPSGSVFNFAYDERENRSRTIDPLAGNIYYNYDARRNIAERILHQGQSTFMTYDHHRQPLCITLPSGIYTTLLWQRDWFGNVAWHQDLGGRKYIPTYDHKNQLTHQVATGGQVRRHIKLSIWDPSIPYLCRMADYNNAPNIDIANTYQFGRLTEQRDNGLGRITTRKFDSENNINQLTISDLSGRVIRDVTAEYDALRREQKMVATHHSVANGITTSVTINTQMDGANNIKHQQYLYTKPDTGQTLDQHGWFAQDDGDRVTVNNGSRRADGTLIIEDGKGSVLVHARDVRVGESCVIGGQRLDADLSYTPDALLTYTQVRQSGMSSSCTYNTVNDMSDYYENGVGHAIHNRIEFNSNRWTVASEFYKDGFREARTEYQMDGVGLPATHQTQYFSEDHPRRLMIDHLSYGYEGFETIDPKSISGYRERRDYPPSAITMGYLGHDENGALNAKFDAEDEKYPEIEQTPIAYFDSTTGGQVLSKIKISQNVRRGAWDPNSWKFLQEFPYIYDVNGLLRGGCEYHYNWINVDGVRQPWGGRAALILGLLQPLNYLLHIHQVVQTIHLQPSSRQWVSTLLFMIICVSDLDLSSQLHHYKVIMLYGISINVLPNRWVHKRMWCKQVIP